MDTQMRRLSREVACDPTLKFTQLERFRRVFVPRKLLPCIELGEGMLLQRSVYDTNEFIPTWYPQVTLEIDDSTLPLWAQVFGAAPKVGGPVSNALRNWKIFK